MQVCQSAFHTVMLESQSSYSNMYYKLIVFGAILLPQNHTYECSKPIYAGLGYCTYVGDPSTSLVTLST